MTFIQLLFYVFSGLSVLSGTIVVTSRNPVYGVLALVFTFFSMAGVWLLLHAEFLALILVLVYVGAVMTLFLFVVMMLPVDKLNKIAFHRGVVRYFAMALLIVVAMMSLMILAVHSKAFDLTALSFHDPIHNENNITSLGRVLYTQYAYPFEIAAVLLLTAIIAAISLTYRKPTDRKIQIISKQVSVKREDRVKLVGGKS